VHGKRLVCEVKVQIPLSFERLIVIWHTSLWRSVGVYLILDFPFGSGCGWRREEEEEEEEEEEGDIMNMAWGNG
jgi:hypothetical protein